MQQRLFQIINVGIICIEFTKQDGLKSNNQKIIKVKNQQQSNICMIVFKYATEMVLNVIEMPNLLLKLLSKCMYFLYCWLQFGYNWQLLQVCLWRQPYYC
ncbi:unnamed protein product (macronuclear) [Paramecium tetraurelia]|uniref:Transmembrane protein n=1 Tax=Paramecium tetraurelia TaxID=5888 RepID=A0CUT4_PARTE|nr:uncharacterized protein GSPATT00039003001 [Paramecium tetraurelia]CAK74551.1 unnamed protein product [Paramecium tetraurelia]|eukprot:XP_001441948.1 hypothetical protein (macronuclear) [Paramecium tetraurelia strain d4-2]